MLYSTHARQRDVNPLLTGTFFMRFLRTTVVLLAPLALLAAGCGGSSNSASPGTVAKIGKETITRQQFDDLLAQAKCSYKTQKRVFPKPGTPEYQQLHDQAVQFLV